MGGALSYSLVALLAAAAAAGPLPASGRLDLSPSTAVWEDRAGTATAAEVMRPAAAGRFTPAWPRGPAAGLVSAFWMRVVLPPAGGAPPEAVLSYDFPLVDRIDLYEELGGRVSHRAGGLRVAPAERTIRHAGPAHEAPVVLDGAAPRAVYLRVVTRGSLLLPPSLWEHEALAAREQALALAIGAGLGLLLLLAALQLYAWLGLRVAGGPAGAAFLLVFAILALALSGFGPALVWPGGGGLWLLVAPGMGGFAAALGIEFARRFLETRTRDAGADRLLLGLVVVQALLGAAGFAARSLGLVALAVALGPSFLAVLWASLRAARRGHHGARRFLAAVLLILACSLYMLLAVLGVVAPGIWAALLLQLGMVLSAAVLTVALADRAVTQNARARRLLEQEVQGRTRELDAAVQKLRAEASDRRLMLEALRESEERFRVAFETSPDAIAINRLSDGAYLAANQGFTTLTGWTREEVLGRSSLELSLWSDPADRTRLTDALRRSGTVTNLEFPFRLRDGSTGTGLLSAQLIQLQGQPFILSVTRSITDWRRADQDRARLQEELRQAQKLEAIGRLAGGVAHDFNNLLTVIRTNAGLSLMELPADHPCRPSFQEIEDAATRATGLTRQLLAFGRRQVIEPRPLDLGAHVGGIQRMLGRLLGEDVELSWHLDPALPPVMADPSQVEQVIINLALNARDALPAGGTIQVATRQVVVGEDAASPDHPAGRFGALEVRDAGAGMAPEVQAHVFEPFFTTKERGTGLGLATVYGIARQHGGFVQVESAPGQGTTFRVHFPLAASGLRAAPPPSEEALPGGGEVVLLAEDEESVRTATRDLLRRLGYQVLEATDGRHALEVADRHPGPIDLLVTDVVMPRLNGRELAAELLRRRPGLPVLFVSGHSHEVMGRNGLLEPGLALVHKPFAPGDLARAVRRALDAARAPAAAGG